MSLDIGQKIKSLRLASDLTQDELARRAGLTKGFISQLENDQTSIGVDSLADMLDALSVTLAEFFSDSSENQIAFSPEERISIEDTGASRFELLVAGSTNNLMDPIFLELQPGESLQAQGPYPGEQFGYVFKGVATLRIDKKVFKVPGKHCFYFKSDRDHQITNSGNSAVSLLWITAPPRM